MGQASRLKDCDIKFLTNLMSDIRAELCECDCCKQEKGCSIFERMYIAGNLFYRNVADFSQIPIVNRLNIFDDISCIDWDTISCRINNGYCSKNKFVNKSRKKILSRFFKYIYDDILDQGGTIERDTDIEDSVDLTLSIFGTDVEHVIENCLDECCNQ